MSTLRSAPLQQAIEQRLRVEVSKRGLTASELARRAGYTERTAQRLLAGDSVSWTSIERTENALRVDILDSGSPDTVKDGAAWCNPVQSDRPIVGWAQAAIAIEVSRWTLWRWRARLSDETKPWWPSKAACRTWWWKLMSAGRSP